MMIETILYVYGFVVFGKFTKLCAYSPTVLMIQFFIWFGPMARAMHDMTMLTITGMGRWVTFPISSALLLFTLLSLK